ncbi:MAG: DUF2267 domain-containing protein [Candidatus Woesearchaeota archaeon]
MTISHISSVEKGVHDFNIWIKEIKYELKCTYNQAYIALYGTMHTLRDRLTIENLTHLGAQLPLIIKGIYYNNWTPKDNPKKLDKMTFISRVHSYFNNDPKINPENVIQTIFYVMQKHIDQGEINNIKATLPPEIENLFDFAAQKKT